MIPEYIKEVMDAVNGAGYECYIVGGAVRDIIRGVPVHDYDLTTSALPEDTIKILTSMGQKLIIDSAVRYGTVVFIDPSDNSNRVEITTFRSEDDYADGRHPGCVSLGASLQSDAARRDFTINSLYMDRDGNILDPNGGRADIEAGIIRTAGQPEERFKEDALRILRAVRFEAKTGFGIEPRTHQAMIDCAGLLKKISAERIYTELTGVVTAIYGPEAIRDNLEVVSQIIPELLIQRDFDQRSPFHDRDLLTHTLDTLSGIYIDEDGKKDIALSWGALLHDIGKPEAFTVDENGIGHMKGHAGIGTRIADRIAGELRFPGDIRDEVCKLVTYHDTFPEPERKSVKRFVSRLGQEFCEKLFFLQRADVKAHSIYGKPRYERLMNIGRIYNEIKEEGSCFSIRDLKVTGEDVKSLGFSEGPLIGKILNEVLSEVLDENIENTYEAEIGYIKDHFEPN